MIIVGEPIKFRPYNVPLEFSGAPEDLSFLQATIRSGGAKAHAKLLVDTGARFFIIDTKTASKLGMDVDKLQKEYKIPIEYQVITLRICDETDVILRDLRGKDIRHRDVPILTGDSDSFQDDDGIVGSRFLQHTNSYLVIDGMNKKAYIGRGGATEILPKEMIMSMSGTRETEKSSPYLAVPLPINTEENMPHLDCVFLADGRKVRVDFGFDTGFNATGFLNESLASEVGADVSSLPMIGEMGYSGVRTNVLSLGADPEIQMRSVGGTTVGVHLDEFTVIKPEESSLKELNKLYDAANMPHLSPSPLLGLPFITESGATLFVDYAKGSESAFLILRRA